MSGPQIVFLVIVFGIVTGVALLAMAFAAPGYIKQRLDHFLGKAEPTALETSGWVEKAAKVARPFSKLSLPEEGWEKSSLRTRFMNAGWRNPAAATLYFAAKTILALGFPAAAGLVLAVTGTAVAGHRLLIVLLTIAAVGYYLPNLILGHIASRRQREIFEAIPDALDLLTVCVEAGLSLERAMIKVAGEIHIKSSVLAQELQLVLMEMRAGFTKEKALRNFALRSGLDDIDTLVAMLIQSERFGTSMGESLRVHSDNLRSKRKLAAEESAAKIGTKLLFPLVFFIFPNILLVLIGPAVIQIIRAFANTGGGQ